MARRPSRKWSGTAKILSHISEISWASRRYSKNVRLSKTDQHCSFESIDPTPCHSFSHPQKQDPTVAFSIQDNESEKQNEITVSEITTRHIRRLASSASDFLGKTINAAVISVPTNFTDEQKEALTKAAKAAGVEVLQMISEPTAAVLAYDARPEAELKDKIIVVADLGGIRSDIAVIASRGGMYSLLSTSHDYETAGSQLDSILVDHFAKEFIKKNKTDPRKNPRSLAKLWLEAEATKKALSLGGNAALSVESLADGLDFASTINRTRYEMLAGKLFSSFTRMIEETIRKAGLDVLDIDEVSPSTSTLPHDMSYSTKRRCAKPTKCTPKVILSGGTSHTPRISQNLTRLFPPTTRILSPSTLPTAIDPSSLAARGAAIQASLIQEFEKDDIEQSTHPVVTATPHLRNAIGIMVVSENVKKGLFTALVEKETAVPCRRAGIFAVPREGGDVLVKICEGMRDIKVTKGGKPKTNGKKGSDESDEGDSEDEDEVCLFRSFPFFPPTPSSPFLIKTNTSTYLSP